MQLETLHPITRALGEIIRGICRDDAHLEIGDDFKGATLRITVTASLDDYRILVGKAGRCIHSMQRIVTRAGEHAGINAELSLTTDNLGETCIIRQFSPNPNFDEARFIRLLADLCNVVGIDASRTSFNVDGNGKLRAVIPVGGLKNRGIIEDINNLAFPYGFTLGRKIDVKTNAPDGAK